MDPRITKLAEHIVNFSCRVKAGELVYIQLVGQPCPLVDEIVRLAYGLHAIPYVNQISNWQISLLLEHGSEEEARRALEIWASGDAAVMEKISCYVEILNDSMLSDMNSDKLAWYKETYYHPVHWDIRMKRAMDGSTTRWTTVRYPSNIIFSHCPNPSPQGLDWVFNLYAYDYETLSQKMDVLVRRMSNADQVEIECGKTSLSFSLKGQSAFKCCANVNIPDGEVFAGPVRESMNGVLSIDVPTWYCGYHFQSLELVIKNGRVVSFDCEHHDDLERLLSIDEGARYFGEFAFGTNPLIDRFIGNIIFDEKMLGTVHFALGNCLEGSPNGNVSAIHWDLVLDLRRESTVCFDGELIMKNGVFYAEDLRILNR